MPEGKWSSLFTHAACSSTHGRTIQGIHTTVGSTLSQGSSANHYHTVYYYYVFYDRPQTGLDRQKLNGMVLLSNSVIPSSVYISIKRENDFTSSD